MPAPVAVPLMLEHPDEPRAVSPNTARSPYFTTRSVLMAVLSA
jgi:hypothetical protein